MFGLTSSPLDNDSHLTSKTHRAPKGNTNVKRHMRCDECICACHSVQVLMYDRANKKMWMKKDISKTLKGNERSQQYSASCIMMGEICVREGRDCKDNINVI